MFALGPIYTSITPTLLIFQTQPLSFSTFRSHYQQPRSTSRLHSDAKLNFLNDGHNDPNTSDPRGCHIRNQTAWHLARPSPSLFAWTLLAHVELRDGKLGIAWDALTNGLHEITDSIKDIQEYYDAFFSESFSPIRTEVIGRVLSNFGDMSAVQILGAILVDEGYPPRTLQRWVAEHYVETAVICRCQSGW